MSISGSCLTCLCQEFLVVGFKRHNTDNWETLKDTKRVQQRWLARGLTKYTSQRGKVTLNGKVRGALFNENKLAHGDKKGCYKQRRIEYLGPLRYVRHRCACVSRHCNFQAKKLTVPYILVWHQTIRSSTHN